MSLSGQRRKWQVWKTRWWSDASSEPSLATEVQPVALVEDVSRWSMPIMRHRYQWGATIAGTVTNRAIALFNPGPYVARVLSVKATATGGYNLVYISALGGDQYGQHPIIANSTNPRAALMMAGARHGQAASPYPFRESLECGDTLQDVTAGESVATFATGQRLEFYNDLLIIRPFTELAIVAVNVNQVLTLNELVIEWIEVNWAAESDVHDIRRGEY